MSFLRTIGPGLHRGVDLVAGAVEEAGVDEHHAVARGVDAGARLALVRRSSSMMPIFSVLRGRPSSVLDAGEELVGEGDLLRPVHLRLDDVDRAGAAVRQRPVPLEVVQRDQRR